MKNYVISILYLLANRSWIYSRYIFLFWREWNWIII